MSLKNSLRYKNKISIFMMILLLLFLITLINLRGKCVHRDVFQGRISSGETNKQTNKQKRQSQIQPSFV